MADPAPDPRLISVELDPRTIGWRNADVEQERRIAIFDLIERNLFRPLKSYPEAYGGPFRLALHTVEGRLAMDIRAAGGERLETLILGLAHLRRSIKDYFAICDSYFQAIRQSTAQQIETVDMARRAIHNEAAELLMARLEGRVEVDFDTARRLFTLICTLHARG